MPLIDVQATPRGRHIQPDGSATDILQERPHKGLDPFTQATHTHEAVVNVNPNDPNRKSVGLGDIRPVSSEDVINIMEGKAKRSRPKGRGF